MSRRSLAADRLRPAPRRRGQPALSRHPDVRTATRSSICRRMDEPGFFWGKLIPDFHQDRRDDAVQHCTPLYGWTSICCAVVGVLSEIEQGKAADATRWHTAIMPGLKAQRELLYVAVPPARHSQGPPREPLHGRCAHCQAAGPAYGLQRPPTGDDRLAGPTSISPCR